MKKIIGIDIRPLETQLTKKRGVGWSNFWLVKELISQQREYEFIFFGIEDTKVRELLQGAEIRFIYDKKNLPTVLARANVSLFHIEDYFFPLYSPDDIKYGLLENMKTVITVHDLFPFYYPEKRKSSVRKLNTNLISILNYVDMIRVNSNNTKNELIEFTKVNPTKIKVIYHGINHDVYNAKYSKADINSVRKKYNLKNNFILQVGAMDFRKNQISLLKAYKKLLSKYKIDLDLVFVGGEPLNEHKKYVYENNMKDHVHFLGIVPDKSLPLIYNAASVFVFPSLSEGFGFPPLEAMACGIPVVSSDRGALPEVLGECALYSDPINIDNLADAIFQVLTDVNLSNRLIGQGFTHVKQYSWGQTASEMLKLYSQILST